MILLKLDCVDFETKRFTFLVHVPLFRKRRKFLGKHIHSIMKEKRKNARKLNENLFDTVAKMKKLCIKHFLSILIL